MGKMQFIYYRVEDNISVVICEISKEVHKE